MIIFCESTECKYCKDGKCERGYEFVNLDKDAKCEDFEEKEQ